MTSLSMDMDIQPGDWAKYIDVDKGSIELEVERIGVLGAGMTSGKPAIEILGHDEKGTAILMQMSYSQFMTAAAAFHARWGHV